MNIDLTDKVAIVTGAAGPSGTAIARALAAAGARIALNDINPDHLTRLAAEIHAAGGQAIDITADVANKFQCVNLIETTRAEWGRLDILVNAQNVRPHVSVIKMDEWEWTRCIDVNLKGGFLMSQLCGRVMADENKGRGGVIINLAYTIGSTPLNAAFAASMAGVVGFARECAREFEPLGIGVTTILLDESGQPLATCAGLAQATSLAEANLPQDIGAAVVTLAGFAGRAQ